MILRVTLYFKLILIVVCTSCISRPEQSNDSEKEIKTTQPWQFVVTGDCRSGAEGSGVNVEILEKVAKAVSQEDIEFVLFTGDLVYGHSDRKNRGDEGALNRLEQELMLFRNTMEPIYGKDIPVYCVRGNHSATQRYPDNASHSDHRPIWPESKKIWDKVMSGKYGMPHNGPEREKNVTFSATHQNAMILGLDLYTPNLDSAANLDGSYPKDACRRVNQEWLDQQLKTKSEHVFVFTHEPAFKVQHNDCMHGDMSYGSDFSEYRNQFWKSISAAGARAYFCGHDHGYAHARIDDGDGNMGNDVHQFVVGTAGAGVNIVPNYNGYNKPYKPVAKEHAQKYGYMLITIDGAEANFEFKALNEETGIFENSTVFNY
jgi:3',5'-cyclic AMP phosphodiesterase CpdA